MRQAQRRVDAGQLDEDSVDPLEHQDSWLNAVPHLRPEDDFQETTVVDDDEAEMLSDLESTISSLRFEAPVMGPSAGRLILPKDREAGLKSSPASSTLNLLS